MNNNPTVSVLMGVYNGQRHLKETIDSILAQTFSDFELLIINDASTDSSEKLILSYNDSRIRYIRNEQNLGLVGTLNKGLTLVKGKYIARMDQDDICFPDRFQKQVQFLDNNPDYGICGANALLIDERGETSGKIVNLEETVYLQINLLFSMPFVNPNTMFRTQVFENEKYDAKYIHTDDYDICCRIAKKWKVHNLQDFLFKYRWHNENTSLQNRTEQDLTKRKVLIRELNFLGINPTEEDLRDHMLTFSLYQFGSKVKISVQDFDTVEAWFGRLCQVNNTKRDYSPIHFTAYVWSRWAVLCFSQKKFFKLLFPQFASYKPSVLCQFAKLLLFMQKK